MTFSIERALGAIFFVFLGIVLISIVGAFIVTLPGSIMVLIFVVFAMVLFSELGKR